MVLLIAAAATDENEYFKRLLGKIGQTTVEIHSFNEADTIKNKGSFDLIIITQPPNSARCDSPEQFIQKLREEENINTPIWLFVKKPPKNSSLQGVYIGHDPRSPDELLLQLLRSKPGSA